MTLKPHVGENSPSNSGAFNLIEELGRERFFGEVTIKFKDGVAFQFVKNQTFRPEDFGGRAAA